MRMKRIIIAWAFAPMLMSCGMGSPADAELINEQPRIYPDYKDVTIPADIAPMNFNIVGNDPDYEGMDVVVKGSKGGEMHTAGGHADFDMDEWHSLVAQNKGGQLTFTVSVCSGGKWRQYEDFNMYVANEELGEYGVTYRRVAPGYEVYGRMGLYQRCLNNFKEEAIIENSISAGSCVNCHTANRTDPQQFTFHVRGEHGATIVQTNGHREVLKAKNDSIDGTMVYPYWHPSGKYCAYSTNQTRQGFHVTKDERIEVFDHSSDLLIYETATHSLILDSMVMTKDHYETYPVFAADGKSIFFCAADTMPIPEKVMEIRYNLCKIGFNPEKGCCTGCADTIINARQMRKSISFPRPSYDGKYLMFTMADYGTFPIWHKEADLYILNLSTGRYAPVTACNSNDTESFHNWSANSRWIVFSSRRGTGLYTRLYFSYIDSNGNASKPFLMPQRNPWDYYNRMMQSYNIPDFTKTRVDFDARAAGREIESGKRINTNVK